ncbi:MAG: CRISPR-associated ring nuclease Csm6 [Methylococcaceae bacterium]
MQSPNRHILLAVTGLSPQIVTETLYALIQENPPEAWPTEVHLITTRVGADHARLNLLSEHPGWFHRFCADYNVKDIRFDSSQITILHDAQGNLLDDIRTPEENETAADIIIDLVRRLTMDDNARLHVSIAGGRKTMGFYLGYALSLYGRTQDRLSHVLVSAPFESHPQFYYPTPYERVIHTSDKTPLALDCREARVTLANIPFVSLRQGLPLALLEGYASFSEVVQAARTALAPLQLAIYPNQRRITVADTRISVPPAELALMMVFARATLNGESPLSAPPKNCREPLWAERYLRERRIIAGGMADLDQTERALTNGMDGDYFSTLLSKLRRRLRKALKTSAVPNLIDDGNQRPRRYRLTLPPEAIQIHTE